MSGLYRQFKTDSDLEQKGVELDYGHCVITIARAGGANKRYARTLEAKTKPYRRAIQTETMDPERAIDILRETYAETIVLNWQTRDEETGKLSKGIEPPEGDKLLPVSTDNIVATFKNLPDLFQDVQEQANKVALFRRDVLENDAKNS